MTAELAELERLRRHVVVGGPMLSIADAAGVLGVSQDTVRHMISAGELPATQLGGVRGRPWRISASTLSERVQGWSERSGR